MQPANAVVISVMERSDNLKKVCIHRLPLVICGLDLRKWINNVGSIVVLHAAFWSCRAMLLVTQCCPTQECCMMRMRRKASCTG